MAPPLFWSAPLSGCGFFTSPTVAAVPLVLWSLAFVLLLEPLAELEPVLLVDDPLLDVLLADELFELSDFAADELDADELDEDELDEAAAAEAAAPVSLCAPFPLSAPFALPLSDPLPLSAPLAFPGLDPSLPLPFPGSAYAAPAKPKLRMTSSRAATAEVARALPRITVDIVITCPPGPTPGIGCVVDGLAPQLVPSPSPTSTLASGSYVGHGAIGSLWVKVRGTS